MLPSVAISKQDGNTGSVKPSTTGVLAIIAASAIGVANQPGTFTRQADIMTAKGLGPQLEYAAYYLQNAGKPVLLITPATSTAAAYSSITKTGTGTSTPTAGATAPLDEYNVIINWIAGGTIGVAGITYTYSLDGGNTTSPVQALGTANSITLNVPIPNQSVSSGVAVNLGAGTIVAADQYTFTTTRAQMTNGDLVTALEALRVTKLPWDAVLIDGDCTSTTVGTVDSWLHGLEATGVFKMAFMNTRHKNLPVPSAESEATFATAMGTLLASTSTIRIDVGTDAGDVASPVTGLLQPRPVSLFTATRDGGQPVGTDPAYVALGSIPNCQISDASGNPKWHDEALYPGLDGLRFTTLRTLAGQQGVFITNGNILSQSGSDYVYDQHVRCANVACTIAFQMLTIQLSRGVRKGPPDPTTKAVYILEQDAQSIEALVNAALRVALKGQVNDVRFILSRTDDLSANTGATLNAEIQIQALAYVKQINVTQKFVRSITVAAAA